jgi:hypothetical protein
MKANSKAMQKLTTALIGSKTSSAAAATLAAATQPLAAAQFTKVQPWAEKCRNATTCPDCNKVHSNRNHAQGWELEANAS